MVSYRTLHPLILFASILFFACVAPKAQAGNLTVYTEISGSSAYYVEGELTGYSVEIVNEIMRRAKDISKINVLPWARGYEQLLKEPGTVLFATTRTKERDNLFHWVGPILRIQWVFLAKKSRQLRMIDSLKTAKHVGKIGTYIGDARHKYLEGEGFTNLEAAASNLSNFRKLDHGRLDLLITSTIGLHDIASQAGVSINDLEIVHVVKEADLYSALSSGTDPADIKAWTDAFKDMQDDGTFQQIHGKWYPGLFPPMDQRRPWLRAVLEEDD